MLLDDGLLSFCFFERIYFFWIQIIGKQTLRKNKYFEAFFEHV